MKRDSRLSGVLHLLIHLMEAKTAVTSEQLAHAMQTNPVVVRRTMAGLRDGGIVSSEKGHGGGWILAGDPATVTLFDIYQALGAPSIIALGHRSENPHCLIEQAVNVALDDAFHEAEAVIFARLRTVTLAQLAQEFGERLEARGGRGEESSCSMTQL